jgi:uncharacterized linocin/CFP29 family protein
MQSNPQVPWTEEQWARVNQAIQEEAQRVRVAATFLPLYGPLSADTDFVRSVNVVRDGKRLTIKDKETIELSTLQLQVELRGAQLADPELGSVLSVFRRAANILARFEDAFIFNGRKHGDPPPPVEGAPDMGEEVCDGKDKDFDGLLTFAKQVNPIIPPEDGGNALVAAVTNAITLLESNGYFGPFTVVLGQQLFLTAHQPSADRPQVSPQDQILPFLNGASVLRCSAIPPYNGIVVALGGEPVELVVATDMSMQFLQVTEKPSYVFRVYEKLALRIKNKDKDKPAIAKLVGEPPKTKK